MLFTVQLTFIRPADAAGLPGLPTDAVSLPVLPVLPKQPAVAAYIQSGQLYYIKNFNSGRYLDVADGKAAKNTNVQQYTFNVTAAQKWKVVFMDDGTYKITSQVGNKDLVLNVATADNTDGGNVNIFTDNNSAAQRFYIVRQPKGTYTISTKCSSYTNCLAVKDASCAKGANVAQYKSKKIQPEMEWIFEPVSVYSPKAAIAYARANAESRPLSFPWFKADCVNFVSQCMLVGGVHFQGDWWIYKKNSKYQDGTEVSELNYSWELADPSPWISAKKFNEFWSKKVTVKTWKISDVLADPRIIYGGQEFYAGDVIQVLNNSWGKPGSAWHTMFITDYAYYDLNGDGKNTDKEKSYIITAHTTNRKALNLLAFCMLPGVDKDNYLRFFTINQPATREMKDEKNRCEGVAIDLTKNELELDSRTIAKKYASFLESEDLAAYAVLNRHTQGGWPTDTVVSDGTTDVIVMAEMCRLIRSDVLDPEETVLLSDYMGRRVEGLDRTYRLLKLEIQDTVENAVPMREPWIKE